MESFQSSSGSNVNDSGLVEKLLSAVSALPGAIQEIGRTIAKQLESQKRDQPLTVVLVGKSGTGKSSTVNSLMGLEVAKVSASRLCTIATTRYATSVYDVPLWVYDTPGLADGRNDDASYLRNIAETVQKVDVLLYVTPLTDRRALNDEQSSIERITAAFGPGVWSRAVTVFTFAEYPQGDELRELLQERP